MAKGLSAPIGVSKASRPPSRRKRARRSRFFRCTGDKVASFWLLSSVTTDEEAADVHSCVRDEGWVKRGTCGCVGAKADTETPTQQTPSTVGENDSLIVGKQLRFYYTNNDRSPLRLLLVPNSRSLIVLQTVLRVGFLLCGKGKGVARVPVPTCQRRRRRQWCRHRLGRPLVCSVGLSEEGEGRALAWCDYDLIRLDHKQYVCFLS